MTAVVDDVPSQTPIQLRDRALMAFLAGTGIRIGAAVTLKLKHVDAEQLIVSQYSQEVATKFSKNQVSTFFPIAPRWEECFRRRRPAVSGSTVLFAQGR